MGRESPMEIWRRRRLAIVVLLVAVVPSYGVSSHATVEAPNALVELEEGASELDAAADNDEQLEKLGAEDLEMGEDESLGTEKKSSRKKSKKKSSWRRKKSKQKSSRRRNWRRRDGKKLPTVQAPTNCVASGTAKCVDLDKDFACPGVDTNLDTWIQEVEINTVTKDDVSYLKGTEKYSPVHFTIKTKPGVSPFKFGTDANKATVYQDGAKVTNGKFVPSTFEVMNQIRDAEKYYDGRLREYDHRLHRDDEKTRMYKLNGGECYAMAAYITTRVSSDACFVGGTGNNFELNNLWLRTLKFSVCRDVPTKDKKGTKPKCATRKALASCWYKLDDGSSKKCEGKVISAMIASRA